MKKISRKIKYDFVIYSSLLLALVLIGYSSFSYLENQSYSLKDLLKKEEPQPVVEVEPVELQSIDKKELINKYLLDVVDEKIKDNLISSQMVLDWKVYEVENIIYKKKIANNYYEYIANIKISNANAELPTIINKELSTDKYVVISLYFNIIKDDEVNEYYIKSTDIPKNT